MMADLSLRLTEFLCPSTEFRDAFLDARESFDEATLELLKMAMADMKLSARGYDRILKVARTIADLAASDKLTPDHVSEAIQYRTLDPQLWS